MRKPNIRCQADDSVGCQADSVTVRCQAVDSAFYRLTVLGARLMIVLGTRLTMLGTRLTVLGTRLTMPGARLKKYHPFSSRWLSFH